MMMRMMTDSENWITFLEITMGIGANKARNMYTKSVMITVHGV